MKLRSLVASATLFISSLSLGQVTVGSSCYVPLNNPDEIKGENIDQRLPIASVSKLITSYWAIKKLGLNFRFPTVLHTSPTGDGAYDIHIQGSRDPYFGAERLHFAISELNKRGITKIRNLTFDESFKFFWSIDDREDNRNLAVGFYLPQDPVPDKVRSQLKAFPSLLAGYQETFDRAASSGVKLIEKPQFTVESIEFSSKQNFESKVSTLKTIQSFVVYSPPLSTLLKEMNRNSNNHAANQIFEYLESDSKFSQFIKNELKLEMKDVVMLNGSGDRVDTAEGPRYNESSCSAMLKILMDMHKTLAEEKTSLARVATVIGSNQGNATSLYSNDKTFDSVIAKTGTVNPAVTLGGVASTQKGLVFFMFNMKTQGTAQTWNQGRSMIRRKLIELMDQFDGRLPVNAKSFAFVSFDKKSFSDLNEVKQESLK